MFLPAIRHAPQDPWIQLDGRLNAPNGGVVPHPKAFTGEFNTYPKRPPWKVAGVDYGVGPPASTVFKNPETGGDPDPTGWSFDRSGRVATATANNAVLDGWDMSAGWAIELGGGTTAFDNAVITNNKIKSGGQGYIITASNANSIAGFGSVVKYNIIDGNFANANNNIVTDAPFVFQYNWYKNVPADMFDLGAGITYLPDPLNSAWDIRFNVIENSGTSTTQHNDLLQSFCNGPNSVLRFASNLVTSNSISGTLSTGNGTYNNAAWGPVVFTTSDQETRRLIAIAIKNVGPTDGNLNTVAFTSSPDVYTAYAPSTVTVTATVTGGASQPSFTIAEYEGICNSCVIDFNLLVQNLTWNVAAGQGTGGYDYTGNSHDVDNTGHGMTYWKGKSSFSNNTCINPISTNRGGQGDWANYCRAQMIGEMVARDNYIDSTGVNNDHQSEGNFITTEAIGVTPVPNHNYNGPFYSSGNVNLIDGTMPANYNGNDDS